MSPKDWKQYDSDSDISQYGKDPLIYVDYNAVDGEELVQTVNRWFNQSSEFMLVVYNSPRFKEGYDLNGNVKFTTTSLPTNDKGWVNLENTVRDFAKSKKKNYERLEAMVNMRSYFEQKNINHTGKLLSLMNGEKYRPSQITGVDISDLEHSENELIKDELNKFEIDVDETYRTKVSWKSIPIHDLELRSIVLATPDSVLGKSIIADKPGNDELNRAYVLVSPNPSVDSIVASILDGIDSLNYAPLKYRPVNQDFDDLQRQLV